MMKRDVGKKICGAAITVMLGSFAVQAQDVIPEPDAIFRCAITEAPGPSMARVETVSADVLDETPVEDGSFVLQARLVFLTEGASLPSGSTTVGTEAVIVVAGVPQGKVVIGGRGTIYDIGPFTFSSEAPPDPADLPLLPQEEVVGGGGGEPTNTATPTSTPTVTPTNTPTSTPDDAPACVGDCNGGGSVSASEIQAIVARIVACDGDATAVCPVPGLPVNAPQCQAADRNNSGNITAGELTEAIFNVNFGCPAQSLAPTATATPVPGSGD